MSDYSEALWATSPDFESHPSGRWEPLQIACFAECRLLDEVSLVKAANAPLDAARPWQDLPHQVHDNQAKSRWLYATGTLASNWPDSWLCRARIITFVNKNSTEYKRIFKQYHLLNYYFLVAITLVLKALNSTGVEKTLIDALFYTTNALTLFSTARQKASSSS